MIQDRVYFTSNFQVGYSPKNRKMIFLRGKLRGGEFFKVAIPIINLSTVPDKLVWEETKEVESTLKEVVK